MKFNLPGSELIPERYLKILQVLNRTRDPFTGRQLERVARLSHSACQRALKDLVLTGLVAEETVGASVLYSLNTSHVYWPSFKSLLSSNRAILDTIAESLSKVTGAKSVFLFGSVARGEGKAASDLDVGVILRKSTDSMQAFSELDHVVSDIHLRTGNELSIFVVNENEVEEMIANRDPLIDSWLKDGRDLWGESVVVMVGRS